jgi:beta-galactosidase
MKTAMKNYLFIVLLLGVFASCTKTKENGRSTEKFNSEWRFALINDNLALNLNYDDSGWRLLNVPHDWSIEGEFNEKNPATVGGGALPGGIGWYRKQLILPASDLGKQIYLRFDGVYRNSEVYVNGQLAGKRPNGYISFEYNITDKVTYGEKANVIAVKVDNSIQPNSRWYSGSGIFRNVWLTKTQPIHVAVYGTYITTPEVSAEKASVVIESTVKNTTSTAQEVELINTLFDKQHNKIGRVSSMVKIEANSQTVEKQQATIVTPSLWSIENPVLYEAVTKIKVAGKLTDSYSTLFGIRNFEFDTAKGFILNGKQVKIVGVCNHHDLGSLGAAVNYRAIERQLEIMKAMGLNGIRTSHNPPAPELLDLCDKMGFIVMDEAFDMWAKKKTQFDYSLDWEQWHVQDLKDQLIRDRNHPSVFIWSIGNEILEQWDSTGITIAKELAQIVKEFDPTRPITSACNDPEPHNNIIKSGALDLIGFNYHHESFEKFPTKFAGKKFIAAETTSSLNTRGSYDMPSDSIRRWPFRWDIPFKEGNPDNTCSSYDNCSAPWGSTHEETWKIIKKHDYLSGMYIWTGFDYLGEPTPYGWPSRSSYFGIVDLAGFPKDMFYMYQSELTDKEVLHIFPHWNWKQGQTIDVWAYTNFDEVELFINDKSQGVKSKQGEDLHLMWRVTYEQGTVKAVGKKMDGTTKTVVINTAGAPAKILLEADRATIATNGEDLSFVTVTVLDKDNNVVPTADNLINFEVSDLVSIAGVDNGCQTSLEPFKANFRKAFNGKCLVILQSKTVAGKTVLKATSEGLESNEIEIILNK